MSKDKSNTDTNLVKSTTNDQIENNNNDNIISNCDVCEYNPKNSSPLSKKEQFLNLFGVKIGEEFYIKSEKERGSYLIYHFNNDLSLLARSSSDKEGIMNWMSPSFAKLLNDDVELIKL